MRTRYKITENDYPYFITFTTIEWIPIFTRKPYFDVAVNSLDYSRKNKGMGLIAYVIMDNHIHLIVSCDQLSKVIKEFKSFTAREIIKAAKDEGRSWLLNQFNFYKHTFKNDSNFQVWQEGFLPKQIMSEEMLFQKIEYIHNNPVRIGLVERPEDWIYSSAKNYLGGNGVLEIDYLEL
jgi:REP element-mobilizing transposase RayT